jgi:DNA-binding GntR family transcriptional regulator
MRQDLDRLMTLEILVQSLNGEWSLSQKARKRVEKLLEMAQRAEMLDIQNRANERDGILDQINQRLCRYRWSPQLQKAGRLPGLNLDFEFHAALEEAYENSCVWWIAELVRQRNILRLRRCAECGRWLWAVKDHQKHCSDDCRKKHATHSPLFKEKRRLYMVKYRRDEKERSAAALLRVSKKKHK